MFFGRRLGFPRIKKDVNGRIKDSCERNLTFCIDLALFNLNAVLLQIFLAIEVLHAR